MNLNKIENKHTFNYIFLLKRIFPFIKPYTARILLGIAASAPAGAADGILALSLKPYLDYVIGNHTLVLNFRSFTYTLAGETLGLLLPCAILIFALIQGILRYLNSYLASWTSLKITNGVKEALYSKLVYMDSSFFDRNTTGILLTRYICDCDKASYGIVNYGKSLLTNFMGVLSLLAVMIYSSAKLAAFGMTILIFAILPVYFIRNKIKSVSDKNIVIGGSIATDFNETCLGNRIMSAYGLQDRRIETFKNRLSEAFNNSMSLVKRAGLMTPIMHIITSAGIAVVLWYGTHLITSAKMTAGGFASFVTSMVLLYKPVKGIGNTLVGVQSIFIALGRVFELFDLKPAVYDKTTAAGITNLNHCIEFKDVNFEYTKDNPVLTNINLKIKKNETVALVGNSGGGKSSLTSLLLRFYDVTSGEVLFDSVNIKDITLDSLRKTIAVVLQDNFLYSGTIKENILTGNDNADDEAVNRAVRAANLEDTIKNFPDGLETVIGERGIKLSGGQKQRIAIARAMLKDAPVIILDEATSALDNESEAAVQKALDNLFRSKTVFIIAHRLSTVRNADRIIVINNGKIVESGTHEELLRSKEGHYRVLAEKGLTISNNSF